MRQKQHLPYTEADCRSIIIDALHERLKNYARYELQDIQFLTVFADGDQAYQVMVTVWDGAKEQQDICYQLLVVNSDHGLVTRYWRTVQFT